MEWHALLSHYCLKTRQEPGAACVIKTLGKCNQPVRLLWCQANQHCAKLSPSLHCAKLSPSLWQTSTDHCHVTILPFFHTMLSPAYSLSFLMWYWYLTHCNPRVCKNVWLKDAWTPAYKHYIFKSYNTSTFSAMHSDASAKKKTKGLKGFRFCAFIGRFQVTSWQWKG